MNAKQGIASGLTLGNIIAMIMAIIAGNNLITIILKTILSWIFILGHLFFGWDFEIYWN